MVNLWRGGRKERGEPLGELARRTARATVQPDAHHLDVGLGDQHLATQDTLHSLDPRTLAVAVLRADVEGVIDPRGGAKMDRDSGDRKGAGRRQRQQRAVLDPRGAQELGAALRLWETTDSWGDLTAPVDRAGA